MVNLTALQNLTEPSFNTSILNSSQNLTSEIFVNANTATNGYFGLIIMTGLCFYLLYEMFREEGFFRYDFIKSGLIATGITTMFGISMILGELFSSWQHVMWFGISFVIFVIATFINKDKT